MLPTMDRITRRAFLAQAAAAGCAGGPSETESAAKPDAPWRLAVGLNGFGSSESHHGKRYEYDEILAFARDEGFEGIELWRNWREGYPDPADAAAITASREKIESYGLQVFSIQAGVSGVNPVSSDASERETYGRKLGEQVDLAAAFGADAMGLWSAGRPYCWQMNLPGIWIRCCHAKLSSCSVSSRTC